VCGWRVAELFRLAGEGSRLRLVRKTRTNDLLEATEEHGDLGVPLDVWYRLAKRAAWKNLMGTATVSDCSPGWGN